MKIDFWKLPRRERHNLAGKVKRIKKDIVDLKERIAEHERQLGWDRYYLAEREKELAQIGETVIFQS